LYALGLLLANPAFAAEPGKSAASQNVGTPPAIQSDAAARIGTPKAAVPTAAPPHVDQHPPEIDMREGIISSVPTGGQLPPPKATPPTVATPTVSVPPKVATPAGGGLPGIDHKADAIRDANVELGRIRDMKQLEELHNSPLNRGRDGAELLNPPQGLPGAGSASAGLRPWERAGSNMGDPNCRSNPAECLRRGAQTGGMGQAPTVGSGVPDNRGMASDGGKAHMTRTSVGWQATHHGSSEGTTTQVLDNGTVVQRTVGADGEVTEHSYSRDSNSTYETNTVYHNDNSSTWTEEITLEDGSTVAQRIEIGADGSQKGVRITTVNGVRKEEQVSAPPPQTGDDEGKPDSTPSETSQQAKGADNCNWNPVWGRCMNKQKPSRKDMTSQPSEGGDTVVGSARHRIGSEAVTNGGGGDWQVSTGGGSGGSGRPYNPRDPGVGPGSDAALDAALGALPTPP